MPKFRILVLDPIAQEGFDLLAASGDMLRDPRVGAIHGEGMRTARQRHRQGQSNQSHVILLTALGEDAPTGANRCVVPISDSFGRFGVN